jgi:hypothetical protein
MKKQRAKIEIQCKYCNKKYVTNNPMTKFCCSNHRVLWHYHNKTGGKVATKNS